MIGQALTDEYHVIIPLTGEYQWLDDGNSIIQTDSGRWYFSSCEIAFSAPAALPPQNRKK
jgi:hypothetical protein